MSYESQTHFGDSIPNTSTVEGERTPQSNITQNIYSIDEVVTEDDGKIKLVPLKNNKNNLLNVELEYNLSKVGK